MKTLLVAITSLFLLSACNSSNGAGPAHSVTTPTAPPSTSAADPTEPADGTADPVAPTVSVPQAPPGTDRIACFFFWRRSDAHSFRAADKHQTVLQNIGDTDAFAIGDFRFDVRYGASSDGGAKLDLSTRAGGATIGSSYDFGTATVPAHLPASGHGFTGLRYMNHPGSGSEIQYFCGAFNAAADLTDDAASQSSPGPGAPAGSTVKCTITASDGTNTERRELVVSTDSMRENIAGFSFSAGYTPGSYDSGGVVIGAGPTADPDLVHTLYALNGTEMPNDLMPTGGFTGVRTIENGSATLSYRCRTEP